MYIRTISRRNKDGSEVRYVQLAHNVWDKKAKCAKAQMIYSFGREDELDREGLKRLARSIGRFLSPEDALSAGAAPPEVPLLRPPGRSLCAGSSVAGAQDRRGTLESPF